MEEDKRALKDSGVRQEFGTGAVRDTQGGKGRFDLMPPHALFRVARVFEKGAQKYAERNWEKGIPLMRYLDSAQRHIIQLMDGDQSEDHAAQAGWNILCYMETLHWIERGELPTTLDNRPARMKPKPTMDPALAEAMKNPGVADVVKLQEGVSKLVGGGTTTYSLPPGTAIQ